MASRIHRVWATCCRQTLLCLQNHWCQGETGSIWWNTALVLPLPFSKRREARKKKKKKRTEEKLKEERGREERQGGKGERLDKMNYAKLSEAAIVGGAGCVKGSQPWSSPAPATSLTTPHGWEPSDLCSGKWPKTRLLGGAGHWWQVDCLGGTHWHRQVFSLLPLFTEVTDREIWAQLHSDPRGTIITGQRLREGVCHFSVLVSTGFSGLQKSLCAGVRCVCRLSSSQCACVCVYWVRFSKNSLSVQRHHRKKSS